MIQRHAVRLKRAIYPVSGYLVCSNSGVRPSIITYFIVTNIFIVPPVPTQRGWRELFCNRNCRNTLTKLHTESSTSVWVRICRALHCLNLKGMLFWERSRSWSSACYGSGRVTLCRDSLATWSWVNGCLKLTFWVSVSTLVRPVACHAWEAVRIGGSGYEVYWLPFSNTLYLVDLYRRMRWTNCLPSTFHSAN